VFSPLATHIAAAPRAGTHQTKPASLKTSESGHGNAQRRNVSAPAARYRGKSRHSRPLSNLCPSPRTHRYGLPLSPGASKWNPVERRLFSFISLEWAGHPLRSLATMMSDIESTTTKTGLKVTAFVNERKYDIQCSMTCSKRFLYSAIRNYQH
jgi:hypothetical protein